MNLPYEWATGVATVALLTWVTFVIRYHVTTRGAWRRYAEGRNAMVTSVGLIAMLLLNVSTRIVRTEPVPLAYPYQGVVALLVYLLLFAAGVQRIVLQARAQRATREDVDA